MSWFEDNQPAGGGDLPLPMDDPNASLAPAGFQPTMMGSEAGAGGTAPDPWANFGAPPATYSSQPWTGGPPPTFTAPTGVTEQNDPGYQFRLDQGNQAIQRSAAAKGTLLSGGTQKALARYNQDYASNEFQNVYNRAQGDFSAQNTTYQNRYGQYLGENARTLSDYLTNVTTQRNAQSDYWTRLLGLSTQGLGAASQGQGA